MAWPMVRIAEPSSGLSRCAHQSLAFANSNYGSYLHNVVQVEKMKHFDVGTCWNAVGTLYKYMFGTCCSFLKCCVQNVSCHAVDIGRGLGAADLPGSETRDLSP